MEHITYNVKLKLHMIHKLSLAYTHMYNFDLSI